MIILAFDGTAKIASVAVCNDDRTLASYSIDNGLTQSELLLPMAEDILKSLKLSFGDVSLLACSVGPGSFTGVRIGASLIKGIAFGRDIPCAQVSTLHALAENLSGIWGIIVPCMDARRGQVYNALFRSSKDGITRLCEDRAISLIDLAKELKELEEERIYLVGDGYEVAKNALTTEGIALEETPEILRLENAASVAKIAFSDYKSGETVTDRDLMPTYLRLPQAERERLERQAISK